MRLNAPNHRSNGGGLLEHSLHDCGGTDAMRLFSDTIDGVNKDRVQELRLRPETVVLPTHAIRDEAVQRRRLAHQKSL